MVRKILHNALRTGIANNGQQWTWIKLVLLNGLPTCTRMRLTRLWHHSQLRLPTTEVNGTYHEYSQRKWHHSPGSVRTMFLDQPSEIPDPRQGCHPSFSLCSRRPQVEGGRLCGGCTTGLPASPKSVTHHGLGSVGKHWQTKSTMEHTRNTTCIYTNNAQLRKSYGLHSN